MDWPRARGILLVALTLVNLVLAYAVWGPTGVFPELSGTPHQQQVQQVREVLQRRGIELAVSVPKTPDPMLFLRVQYRPTVDLLELQYELFGKPPPLSGQGQASLYVHTRQIPSVDTDTQVLTIHPQATGTAERQMSLDNPPAVQQEVRDYLRSEQLFPFDARFSGIYPRLDADTVLVEFVPEYADHQVFSGYTRAEVSARGIESVAQFWVQPLGFKETPPKVVRPAAEALLRLAGHLEQDVHRRTITDIRLGYYAGRSLTTPQAGEISAWDTVPVWRIRLESGETYYINAFNGEIEA